MRVFPFTITLAFLSTDVATAYHGLTSQQHPVLMDDSLPWSPPGPHDVRAPCPGINTLANHHLVPHSGRGVTIDDVIRGMKVGFNIGEDVAMFVALLGLKANPIPNSETFDLDMLDQHNCPIEHDGSLSRGDAHFGDDHTFSPPIFDSYLRHFEGEKIISIEAAAKARTEHVFAKSIHNPEFFLDGRLLNISLFESVLILSVFGDPIKGNARKDWVQFFFENERLPFKLGWTPRKIETTFITGVPILEDLITLSPPGIPLLFNNSCNVTCA